MSRQSNELSQPAPTGKLKRLGFALALAFALAASIIAPVAAKLLHIRYNLSTTASVTSGFPAIVINPFDASNPSYGEYVAVAWTDGVDSTSGHQGPVQIKFTTESSGLWFKHTVLPGSSSSKSKDVALAADPQTANRVHLLWNHDDSATLPDFEDIFYASCTLNVGGGTASCTSPPQAVEANTGFILQSPDLAIENNSQVHAVWVKQTNSPSSGDTEIRYAHKADASWGSFQTLDSGGKRVQPAIAHSTVGGTEYLHLVWVDQTNNLLRYWRRVKTAGTWGVWEAVQTLFNPGLYTNPGSPDVAAVGADVYVMWDVTKSGGSQSEFYLLYNHSPDSGANWDGNKCLPSQANPATGCPTAELRTSGFQGDTTEEYDDRLRPKIFMEITGTLTIPHLVWHESFDPDGSGEAGARWDVLSAYLMSGNWITNTNPISKPEGSALFTVAPMMVVGQNGEKQFVYMEPRSTGTNPFWDVIYWGDDIPPFSIKLPLILK